jgi:hypothetical protein
MALSASLRLDLTNILVPLMGTVVNNERVESSEAITRSGSDQLTELKLAALIGRLRIEDAIKTNFRTLVAASNQTKFSRYLQDLTLEAGAGPTIQQALTSLDPARLSMAIQISFLAFGHEHQSLAEAITQAIEETLVASNNPPQRGLDYISVLGVIIACQQQTAAFGWAYFYDAVDAKIIHSIKEHKDGLRQNKRRRTGNTRTSELPSSIRERGLPYVILKSLLIHLISIQDFPEHRLLHLSTERGTSTIVIWCYYILGLNVKVTCGKVDIVFGEEPYHVCVEECDSSKASSTLLERVDEGEPLFTFSTSGSDPVIPGEYRLEAKGFAKKSLTLIGISSDEAEECAHWLAAGCLKHFGTECKQSVSGELGLTTMETQIGGNIIPSTLFLFDMAELDENRIQNLPGLKHGRGNQVFDRVKWQAYAVLIYIFARLSDLQRCGEVPLSLTAFRDFKKDDHGISRSGSSFTGPLPDILLSYDLLARLLLGRRYSMEFMQRSCLVSAYGWSLFFDSFDAADPADITTGLLHLALGVPTRIGCRKDRIIDGPTNIRLTSSDGVVLNSKRPRIEFWPGVWSGRHTGSYIGNSGRDAFTVVQHLEWARENLESLGSEGKPRSWKFGFRQKVEFCRSWAFLGPCPCNDEKTTEEEQIWLHKYIPWAIREREHDCKHPPREYIVREREMGELTPERIFCKKIRDDVELEGACTWFFFVGRKGGAARWLALDGMNRLDEVSDYNYLLRGKDCCISCAVKQVQTRSLVLL